MDISFPALRSCGDQNRCLVYLRHIFVVIKVLSIMSKIFSLIIMWWTWVAAASLSVLMACFLTKGAQKIDTFSRPFDVFAAGMFVIPVLICGGLRFWMWRMRNPWLALLPFSIGLFFAWQAGLYGIFLFPEFFIVFQTLGGILLLAYLPLFIKFQPAKNQSKPA